MIEASFREIILERDNVNVMKAIMAPCTNRSRLGHIFEDVYYFRAFSISHVFEKPLLVMLGGQPTLWHILWLNLLNR